MSEFVSYLSEVFESFGEIRSRRMFGGHGIYHMDLMIGLVADDMLYLKADHQTSPFFDELGLQPFEYVKNGKSMKMSYYLAPDEIFDDQEIAKLWAQRAYQAASRVKRPTKKNKKLKRNSR